MSSACALRHLRDNATRNIQELKLFARAAPLALSISIALFAVHALRSLLILEFGDETEKFVAAQMMVGGARLYRDIFANHGPLPYVFAHAYASLINSHDFSYVRLVVIAFATTTAIAIYFSSAFRTPTARMWGVTIFLLIIAGAWVSATLHMLYYHTLVGYLVAAFVALALLPSLQDTTPRALHVALGGCALSLACFASYAVGLSCIGMAIALCLSELARRPLTQVAQNTIVPLVSGALAAAALMFAWLYRFADISGYLIYHFYFNTVYYAAFSDLTPWSFLGQLKFLPDTSLTIHNIVLTSFILLSAIITSRLYINFSILRLLSFAVVLPSILLLNAKGGLGFPEAPLFIVILTFISAYIPIILQYATIYLRTISSTIVVVVSFLLFLSPSTIHGLTPDKYWRATFSPIHNDEYNFIRKMTPAGKTILATPFVPAIYIWADRLPASGQFFYLPFQAAYSRSPFNGYVIDFCSDLLKSDPPIIVYYDGPVWGNYLLPNYEPCFGEILASRYARNPTYSNVYVRRYGQ